MISPQFLFAVGTLLAWIGWGFALSAVAKLARYFGRDPRVNRPAELRGAFVAAAIGGVTLLVSSQANLLTPTKATGVWRFPLTWFVMPFTAWLMAIALVMISIRSVQSFLAITPEERTEKLQTLFGWLVVIAIAGTLYFTDRTSKIDVLTGGIEVSPATGAGLLFLAVAAVAGMTLAAQATRSRDVARGLTSQLMLLIGSFVFGIPFVFALVTSFKEDQDMVSPSGGIVWIPRVQQTVPYMDKKTPLYAADYKGKSIQGTVLDRNADGSVTVDIFKPLSIRGTTFQTDSAKLKEIPRDAPVVTAKFESQDVTGFVTEELEDGRRRVEITEPDSLKGKVQVFEPAQVQAVRKTGLRWQNYEDTFSYLPPETNNGLVYLKNTLILVIFSVIGTIMSSAIVAYAFSRMSFPGKEALFKLLLSTMMLPAAVTLLPQFLIFRGLGWIDTLFPLWVPAFFGSAFNIFLLRQFFKNIPMELEDASKIDGCSYIRTFWDIMLPQIKPALAVIAIWTFMGAWNNFMGPLIYINSPENMPLSYALQLFQGERSGEPGLLMAFSVMTMMPVLLLFFFAQRYFIEGVTLSGLGGR